MLRDEGNITIDEVVRTAFLELHGEEVEKLAVAVQVVADGSLVAQLQDLVLLIVEMCHTFHFWQFVFDKVLHAVAIGHFVGTHGINSLTVGVLSGDGILLHHIAEADDDEGKGNA